jgi:hypothetical protein
MSTSVTGFKKAWESVKREVLQAPPILIEFDISLYGL